MRGPLAAAVAIALSSPALAALDAKIFADTNRDGHVDIVGTTDSAGKCSSGADEALFLAAVTDTDGRCKSLLQVTDEAEWGECHDGSDNVLRHPERLALVRTSPLKDASNDTLASIAVTCDDSFPDCADKVRLFRRSCRGDWVYLEKDDVFKSKALRNGLVLGIDGRDVRRPDIWDGRVTINFTVWDGSTETSTDCVRMRVAPVMTHHHLQTAEKIFATADLWDYQPQLAFIDQVSEQIRASGIEEEVLQAYGDIWTQDFFEPGFTTMPGPSGPVGIRVMVRSAQPIRESGRAVFEQLRSADVGAIQHISRSAWQDVDFPEDYTLNSNGNHEAIPPYSNGPASFPAGRIIMGEWEEHRPEMVPFWEAQEIQEPLILDTDWLAVGHVDEFIQFLPADNERGFVLMISDPLAGLALLTNASAAGHGSVLALSRTDMPYDFAGACHPNHTIDEVLAFPGLEADQKLAAEHIEGNLALLKREIGLTDSEVFRVPSTFQSLIYPWACPPPDGWDDGLPIETPFPEPTPDDSESRVDQHTDTSSSAKHVGDTTQKHKTDHGRDRPFLAPSGQARHFPKNILEAAGHVRKSKHRRRQSDDDDKEEEGGWWDELPGGVLAALFPGVVNGLVLPDRRVVGPNPWGPVIDGEDIIAKAVTDVYSRAGATLTFIDNYWSHHVNLGEVHCGTNSWRAFDDKWW